MSSEGCLFLTFSGFRNIHETPEHGLSAGLMKDSEWMCCAFWPAVVSLWAKT